MTGLLIRDCDVEGRGRVDVRVRDGAVVEIGAALPTDGLKVIDAAGGALIPGLHDHHLHLFALAAHIDSVDSSPPAVRDAAGFATVLRTAASGGPVRATGYFESVAGPLDRDVLDRLVADVPVRVQHRSGAVWFLNSTALAAWELLDATDPAIERDAAGRAIGRIVRGDHLFRRDDAQLPTLGSVGALLASYGVTGVTDATPRLDNKQLTALRGASSSGAFPQRLLLLGTPVNDATGTGVPWKILVDEVAGLDPAALADEVRAARLADRPVALHCTSRAETVLAITALREVGPRFGDRLEHAGVLPPDLDNELALAGVVVVTQPHFIAERGDDYLAAVETADHELLYRCGSLLKAGVGVAAGTDAPYGQPDPWAAIDAATRRCTKSGAVIGAPEQLDARRALDLFLGEPLAPGGPPRRITTGAVADLCLLDLPLDEALTDLSADHVTATVIAGHVVHHR